MHIQNTYTILSLRDQICDVPSYIYVEVKENNMALLYNYIIVVLDSNVYSR